MLELSMQGENLYTIATCETILIRIIVGALSIASTDHGGHVLQS